MKQQINEIKRMQQLAGLIKENETNDEKIERYEKYKYTLNGEEVQPEIAFYNHVLGAEVDGKVYRINAPVNGTIELSLAKGKTGSYT